MDKNELFHDELLNQTHLFDCIISDIEKNEININDCINRMTNVMYGICKKCFGKKVNLNKVQIEETKAHGIMKTVK